MQLLAACQVNYFRQTDVEGIIIFFTGRKILWFFLRDSIQGKFSWFFPQTYPILRDRKQSTERNYLAPGVLLTQATERQTLTFGKWFLKRKKKQKLF